MDTTPSRELEELSGSAVTITVCPDGPLLVRGPAVVLDGAGVPVSRREGNRPVPLRPDRDRPLLRRQPQESAWEPRVTRPE